MGDLRTGAFAPFPNLPAELRLLIWRSTLPGPRNVGVKIHFTKQAGFGGWVARRNTAPAPIALQVCHESREEALKHYILSFGTSASPPTVYFNYAIDTLCFRDLVVGTIATATESATAPSDYLLNLWVGKTLIARQCAAHQAANIRFLTLDVDESIYSRPSFCWDEIRRFEGLEKLLLIAWSAEEDVDLLVAYFEASMQAVAEEHTEWVVPETTIVDASSGRTLVAFRAG